MIYRGDVYWVNFDNIYKNTKHHQKGTRPCIIISNNYNNRNCSTVQVIPTTTAYDGLPQHKYVYINNILNYVLPEHITTINKSDLLLKYSIISKSQFKYVNEAIDIQLGKYRGDI